MQSLSFQDQRAIGFLKFANDQDISDEQVIQIEDFIYDFAKGVSSKYEVYPIINNVEATGFPFIDFVSSVLKHKAELPPPENKSGFHWFEEWLEYEQKHTKFAKAVRIGDCIFEKGTNMRDMIGVCNMVYRLAKVTNGSKIEYVSQDDSVITLNIVPK